MFFKIEGFEKEEPFKEKSAYLTILKLAHPLNYMISKEMAKTIAQMVYEDCEITEFNPIADWILKVSPGQSQGQRAYQRKGFLDKLVNTIEIDPIEKAYEPFYKTLIRKIFYALVANQLYTGNRHAGTKGLLILTGPQAVGKSTWLNSLLPPHLRDYIYTVNDEVTPAGSIPKDIRLATGRNAVVIFDEVERFINTKTITTASVKNFIISKKDDVRPLYGTTEVKVKRRCILVGATNKDDLIKDSTGNRRTWIIPILRADGFTVEDMGKSGELQQAYAEAWEEVQEQLEQNPNVCPWDLTPEERKIINDKANITNKADLGNASVNKHMEFIQEVETKAKEILGIDTFSLDLLKNNKNYIMSQSEVLKQYNILARLADRLSLAGGFRKALAEWATLWTGSQATISIANYNNIRGVYIKNGLLHASNSSKSAKYFITPFTLLSPKQREKIRDNY